jgi:hypothetical protein
MTTDKIKPLSLENTLLLGSRSFSFVPVDGTYILDINLAYDGMVNQIDIVCNSGTLNAQVTIDETPVSFTTDGTTVSVSSTAKSRTAASSNDFSAGGVLRLVVSSTSGATLLEGKVTIQRTA